MVAPKPRESRTVEPDFTACVSFARAWDNPRPDNHREQLPRTENPAKRRVKHRTEFLPDPWVFGFRRLLDTVTEPVRPLLARVRDLALRVPCPTKEIGNKVILSIQPDILALA